MLAGHLVPPGEVQNKCVDARKCVRARKESETAIVITAPA